MHQFATLLLALLAFSLPALPTQAGETVTYYHLDALGSPVAATDEQGNLKWREKYRPYGSRIKKQTEADSNSRWYTGHSHDEEFGLTYAGARYYDPVVGRFMGVDPVPFQENVVHSFNRYAYGNNNPYKYVDPDGLFGQAIVGVSVGIGIWVLGEAVNIAYESYTAPDPATVNGQVTPSGAIMPAAVGRLGSKLFGRFLNRSASITTNVTKGRLRGVDDLVGAASGKARSSGDIVVQGGRGRAKKLFREFDSKGVGNRTLVRDKTGGGRGVEGALEDGTPIRIRMKPDGTTRIQAGDQKFIFPPK
jgi:RHS repeat-associated protein